MKRAKSIVSAVAAVLCAGAVPAAAQGMAGGPASSDVQINWAALDRLGPPPDLPGMLQGRQGEAAAPSAEPAPSAVVPPPSGAPVYKPYAPGGAAADSAVQGGVVYKPYAPPHHRQAAIHVTHPAPAKVAPAVTARPAAAEVEEPAKPAPAVAAAKPAAAPPPRPVQAEPAAPAKPAPAPEIVAAVPPAPVAEVPAVPAAPAVPAQVVPAPAAPAVPAQVAPAVPAQVAPAQVASVPAAPVPPTGGAVVGKGDTLSMAFDGASTDLPAGADAALKALAKRMQQDGSLNLQLLSYASGDETDFAKAHRLSLSRALEVRNALKDLGVSSTRIDVRALGTKLEGGGPADRVDAVLVSR